MFLRRNAGNGPAQRLNRHKMASWIDGSGLFLPQLTKFIPAKAVRRKLEFTTASHPSNSKEKA
jgi:hypothetical protein